MFQRECFKMGLKGFIRECWLGCSPAQTVGRTTVFKACRIRSQSVPFHGKVLFKDVRPGSCEGLIDRSLWYQGYIQLEKFQVGAWAQGTAQKASRPVTSLRANSSRTVAGKQGIKYWVHGGKRRNQNSCSCAGLSRPACGCAVSCWDTAGLLSLSGCRCN